MKLFLRRLSQENCGHNKIYQVWFRVKNVSLSFSFKNDIRSQEIDYAHSLFKLVVRFKQIN